MNERDLPRSFGRAKKKARTIALPRPKGTRATSRSSLTITMHPGQLAQLEARAAAVSMSLTAYVVALLASDAEDVSPPRARNPRINWLEDNSGATIARRCARRVVPDGSPLAGNLCVLPTGHSGECSSRGPLRPEPECSRCGGDPSHLSCPAAGL